ncbi:MAG: hypothetical protein IT324_22285 [Anaerolineae bacterium]|nr:hypothetical protein [Anaerolineae bacterium]
MGILGTNAPLTRDLTLLAYIFLIVPAMLTGFAFARRQMFVPHHKLTMTSVVIINWLLIIFLMLVSYRLAVAPKFPDRLNDPSLQFNIVPTIHLLFGLAAQIIGTILVLRMWFENVLPPALRFEPIKPWMRLTLALWLITAVLGAVTYLTWYKPRAAAPPTPAGVVATQAATPAATEEATPGGAAATQEATPASMVATQEVTPVATQEATVTPGSPVATSAR